MKVNVNRKEYNDNLDIWTKCRDVVEGQEKVHSQGKTYLPYLTGQTKAEYDAYRMRALFYNASQRTVDAMSGLLFRKEPKIVVPAKVEPYLENIDLQGNNLINFAENVADEVLTVSRLGLLVEHPQVEPREDGTERTQAEAEAENLRPFIVNYKAEDIINWNCTTVNNVKVLDLVVLREVTEVYKEDSLESEIVVKFRVLILQEGVYVQKIFKETPDGKSTIQDGDDIIPKMNGKPLPYIPFIFISSKGSDPKVEKSAILDLVNVNLSHYRTTADIEHAAHFTALPTPVVSGHTAEDNEVLKIGGSEAWVFTEENAKAYYLEYSGSGIAPLEKRLEKKEEQMAALGARMLMNEKASVEATETHAIKRQGENSALSSIAQSISDGIRKALTILCEWSGVETNEVIFLINKDFIPSTMQPQMIVALLQAWQQGGIAFTDLITQLQKGEIVDGDRTVDDIKLENEADGIKIEKDEEDDFEEDDQDDLSDL